jgi:hypothetical protein
MYIHFQSSRISRPPVLETSKYISSPVVFPVHRSLGQLHTFSVQLSFQSTGPWDSYIHFQSSCLSSPPVLGTATYISSHVVFPAHQSLGQVHTFQSSRLSSPPVLGTATYIFSPVVFPVHRSLGQLHTFFSPVVSPVHLSLGASTYISSQVVFPVHRSLGQVHTVTDHRP